MSWRVSFEQKGETFNQPTSRKAPFCCHPKTSDSKEQARLFKSQLFSSSSFFPVSFSTSFLSQQLTRIELFSCHTCRRPLFSFAAEFCVCDHNEKLVSIVGAIYLARKEELPVVGMSCRRRYILRPFRSSRPSFSASLAYQPLTNRIELRLCLSHSAPLWLLLLHWTLLRYTR